MSSITHSRRRFLRNAALASSVSVFPAHCLFAENADSRTAEIVRKTFGIDTHNHIDVPLTSAEMPGPAIDLSGELKRSGLAAICMTFATDYQPGDPYQCFKNGLTSMDRALELNHMKRALSAKDVRAAHEHGHPIVIQALEGSHFLEGHVERVEEAYSRGLRVLGLLHDSDASTPLGDVYTNPPRFGGLTTFGAEVVKRCNRLGILVDLAHANTQTTEMALKASTRPAVISHTGPDWRLGENPRMAQMMRPRLISKAQARLMADHGGLVGVWTHLADTPLAYAQNLRAMADVIGVDHVCIGTDTKLTQPAPRGFGPPPGGGPGGQHHEGPPPQGGPEGNGFRPGQQHARVGERTNEAWEGETTGFYYTVVDAMLKTGFTPDEIAKIGGGNFLRVFSQAVS
ncbi:MAG: membrane dipeptidase [Acidobacteriaceae bacterium]|nr:membrane dipeptidase [Acidobacteriaceae bacterium]